MIAESMTCMFVQGTSRPISCTDVRQTVFVTFIVDLDSRAEVVKSAKLSRRHMWYWIWFMDYSEYSNSIVNLFNKSLVSNSRLSKSIGQDGDLLFDELEVGYQIKSGECSQGASQTNPSNQDIGTLWCIWVQQSINVAPNFILDGFIAVIEPFMSVAVSLQGETSEYTVSTYLIINIIFGRDICVQLNIGVSVATHSAPKWGNNHVSLFIIGSKG